MAHINTFVRQASLFSKHYFSTSQIWLLMSPKRIPYILGLLGFYWYALTIFMGPDGHLISVGLLLIAFVGYWVHQLWPEIRRSSLFWLALATTLYVLIRTLFACLQFPDNSSYQIEMGLKMAHMSGLISLLLLPWLIEEGKERRADWVLFLLVASFLGNIYLNLNWTQFSAIISPQEQFYFKDALRVNPNTAGFLAGILLLGFVTVGSRWLLKIIKSNRYIWFLFALISWLTVTWILLFTIINSESRSGWIAIGLVLIVSLIVSVIYNFYLYEKQNKIQITLLICFMLGGCLVIWNEGDRIVKQFDREKKTLTLIAHGQVNDLPEHSMGIRMRLWKFGFNLFEERPIFGWGPGSIKHNLKKNGSEVIKHHGHLHSALFQLIAQFGAVGAILFLSLFILSIFELIKASMMNLLPVEWVIFGVGGLLTYFIYSSVNSPFHHEQYRYMLIILIAIAMSSQIKRQHHINN